MKILIMDFGTSSIKFSVLDENCTLLKTAKVPYQIRVYNGDWVEMDGTTVLDAMFRGIRGFGDFLHDVDLIGFDNFSPSMTFMDETGEALYPIFTHLDRRSKKQTQDILAGMGKEKFQSITGIQPFTGGASITSVLWMKENEEQVFRSACRLGHLNTFIYKKLTGLWYTDPVNASMTGMYETITGKGWSKEICSAFGIPLSLLPEIKNAGAIAGSLTKEAADLCGLKAGIPVALGSNDAAAAQIGAHNTKAGHILNISGSSEMVSILTDTPRIDDRYYLRCSATPGLWQIYATTASGFALDWFRKEFYRDMGERDFFSKEFPRVVDQFLDKTPVRFLPYIAGDRQSLTPKKGAFTELTLDTTREDFLAAILLGIHEPIKAVIGICENFIKLNKTIKLTGGMIDPAFLRVKEKLFQAYRFEIIPDCPMTGSAMLAMDALNNK
ncbi:carbohydrate kinase [Spirochaetia bacterium]|nr:carbohydrate kinase [Spirochaetia bacterium]